MSKLDKALAEELNDAYRNGYIGGLEEEKQKIIHCKDCKHCVTAPSGILCCGLLHGLVKMTEDSFCSYAERKDAE